MRKNIYINKDVEIALQELKKEKEYYNLSDSAIIRIILIRELEDVALKRLRDRENKKLYGKSTKDLIELAKLNWLDD